MKKVTISDLRKGLNMKWLRWIKQNGLYAYYGTYIFWAWFQPRSYWREWEHGVMSIGILLLPPIIAMFYWGIKELFSNVKRKG